MSSFLSEKVVVNVLRSEYSEWISNLNNEEIHAIRKYSYNSNDFERSNRFFERLNRWLRGEYNENNEPILKKYAKIISDALKKHPTKHSFICYRRVNYIPFDESKIGHDFKFNQFISTSVIQSKTIKGKYLLIIHIPIGTLGAYIEELSCFPKQREFLLDKDCIYRILSIKEDIIEVEVIV